MDVTWIVKYITELLGTAILIILGNGAVANVELKGTKGHQSGWLVIAVGYDACSYVWKCIRKPYQSCFHTRTCD